MIIDLIKIAFQSKGLQQSVLTVVGNFFSAGLSALALIIISRSLGPSTFGEFSFGFALIMIISRVNEVGLNSALMKFGGQTSNIKKLNIYYSVALKLKLHISLCIIIIGLFSYSFLNSIFNLENKQIILVAFTFGLSTIYLEHLNAIFQSLHKFNQAVVTNFLQSLAKLLGIALLLYFKIQDVVILFTFYSISPLFPLLGYKKLLPDKIIITTQLSGKKENNELLQMAKHTSFANISTVLVSQVSVLFVQGFLTSYDTGILGGVSKIQMLFSILTSSLGNVLFPRVSRYKSKNDLKSFIKKSFLMLILTLVGLIMSIILAKQMILVTIGPDYLPGINVLYILLTSVFISIATVPFTALFYSFNKNLYFSLIGIVQVVLILTGNFILIPKIGIIGAAYTQLITMFAIFVLTLTWSLIIYNKKFKLLSFPY